MKCNWLKEEEIVVQSLQIKLEQFRVANQKVSLMKVSRNLDVEINL